VKGPYPPFECAIIVNDLDIEAKTNDFIFDFNSILFEALPFIILGAVLSGILEELVPQGLIPKLGIHVARILKKFLPRGIFRSAVMPPLKFFARNRPIQIILSAWLGLLFPMCECGIIPVMRRLLRKGLPLSCCISYMLAGPIINVVVMLSTYMAFFGQEIDPKTNMHSGKLGGVGMAVMRTFLGFLVAVGTSLVVERQYRKHGANKLLAPDALPVAKSGSAEDDQDHAWSELRVLWKAASTLPGRLKAGCAWFGRRLGSITEASLHDFVDITVYLILGAMLAAFTRQCLDPNKVAAWGQNEPLLGITITMALAILLCLCSEADAFVAASFFKELPISAKLSFLTLGPMLDFKLYFMYTRVFKPRLIWTIVCCVVVQVFVYSTVFHYVYEICVAPYLKANSS
jgi:uncharacterized membrane protein YraQ (UPF0718 family)